MVTLTREEIYQLVWTMPMTAIAKIYQISDVGFRKICVRMKIPIPTSGYWSKVQAGHRLSRPSLPPAPKGNNAASLKERLPSTPVSIPSELQSLIKKVALEKLPFKVPDRLTNPDPLTLVVKEQLKKLTDPNFPGMVVTGKDQLNIRVSPANTGRALRFMDTLVKCVRARGLDFITEGNHNYIQIDGIKLALAFREKTTRVKANTKSYLSYKWEPNGKVVFRLEGRQRAEWGDLKKRLLEDQLPQILAKLILVARKENEYLANARLWQQNWELERKVKAEREARQRTELQAFRDLIKKSQRWQKCEMVRSYVTASKSSDKDWLAWVNAKLNWYDPSVEADDFWLSDFNRDEV
ncbi:MAG: hypothetical protein V4456_16870 [Bacteroidota bacterium]